MDALTQETIDYVAVNRLHHAYADIATRRAWAELDEIFVPDIPIVIDLRDRDPYVFDSCDGFRGFVSQAVDTFEFFEFVIFNSRVYLNHEGDPDAAVARMYMSELRQDHAEHRWSQVYGVYHDRFRRIDGRWWYVGRNYSSLARPAAKDLDAFDFPSPEPF
jgi:SnoaL-like domain